MIVASMKAPFGPPLTETDKVEITLTVEGGDDTDVRANQGNDKLRQGQILRLTEEALGSVDVLNCTWVVMPECLYRASICLYRASTGTKEAGFPLKTCGNDSC